MLSRKCLYFLPRKINKRLYSGEHFSSSPFKEHKVKVRNYLINYIRIGDGPHQVFCAPGIFGNAWRDFKKQIESFDRKQFSLLFWDPPGFGKSVAIDNEESLGVFSRDADIAYEFMKALEISKYSVMGWSYGGLVSLLVASRHQDVINKVVTWGCGTFVLDHELDYYKSKEAILNKGRLSLAISAYLHNGQSYLKRYLVNVLKRPKSFKDLTNLNNWEKSQREELIKFYGEEQFKKKIDSVIKSMEVLCTSKVTFCDEVKRIKCPTLILRGEKDPVVDVWHFNNLRRLIKNCRIHLYPKGKHNIHQKYAEDFNRRVQEFLLETN